MRPSSPATKRRPLRLSSLHDRRQTGRPRARGIGYAAGFGRRLLPSRAERTDRTRSKEFHSMSPELGSLTAEAKDADAGELEPKMSRFMPSSREGRRYSRPADRCASASGPLLRGQINNPA